MRNQWCWKKGRNKTDLVRRELHGVQRRASRTKTFLLCVWGEGRCAGITGLWGHHWRRSVEESRRHIYAARGVDTTPHHEILLRSRGHKKCIFAFVTPGWPLLRRTGQNVALRGIDWIGGGRGHFWQCRWNSRPMSTTIMSRPTAAKLTTSSSTV